MKCIKQKHDDSCGQTCIAMLTGAPYDDVIDSMGESYTSARDLHKALAKFGLKSPKRLVQFRGNKKYPNHRALNVYAILKLVDRRYHNRRYWHWVVRDAKRRKILDPQWHPYKVPPARITSFLPVWR
jgi:hypothetical protein